MINTKFKDKKLEHYLENQGIPFNDNAIVNILESYITKGEYTKAITLADILIENNFNFSREGYLNFILDESLWDCTDWDDDGINYATSETPSVKLKFIRLLFKLYKYTQNQSYYNYCISEAERLNTCMTVGEKGPALTSTMLLYDENSNVINSKRYGTYISDLTPSLWFILNYSSNYQEQITLFSQSQSEFLSKAGFSGPFVSYYNTELLENEQYGDFNTWLFDGPLKNELDFYHQYKAAMNIAIYYYERFKHENYKDSQAKEVLNSFLDYLNNRGDIPDNISESALYAENEEIYAESTIVYAEAENTYKISQDKLDLLNAAMLGIAAIYKFKVDKESYCFEIAEKMIETILNYQLVNGSISNTADVFSEKEAVILEFFRLYQSVNRYSYYDIINNALALLNVEPINENNKDIHSCKVALTFCQDGINKILLSKYFEFAYTKTYLEYAEGSNVYDLKSMGIDEHRIDTIGYFNNGNFVPLREISYENYLEFINRNPETKAPTYFAYYNGNLYLYNYPDKNYGFIICHYKLDKNITYFDGFSQVLPQCYSHILKWYIAWKLAILKRDELADFYESMYRVSLGTMTYTDDTDLSQAQVMPGNIRW